MLHLALPLRCRRIAAVGIAQVCDGAPPSAVRYRDALVRYGDASGEEGDPACGREGAAPAIAGLAVYATRRGAVRFCRFDPRRACPRDGARADGADQLHAI